MKRTRLLTFQVCLVIFCLALSSQMSLATGVSQEMYREMSSPLTALEDQADVICVASFVSVRPIQEAPPFRSNYDYFSYAITLNVQSLWKGSLPGSQITLKAWRLDYRRGGTFAGYREDFTQFQPRETYLIFAKKLPSGGFALVNPSNGDVSAYQIGAGRASVSLGQTLSDRILAQSLLSAGDPDERLRLPFLFFLGCLSDQLDRNPSSWAKASAEILASTRAKDMGVRMFAYHAAAKLDLRQALPGLISLARSSADEYVADQAADALCRYPPDTALPYALSLLKSPSPRVKSTVLLYLSHLHDRRTLPYLLDALADSSKAPPDVSSHDVNYYIVSTLDMITDMRVKPIVEYAKYTPLVQEDYTAFWKHWAALHQDELTRLRREVTVK